jgi:hypothetical protein
MDLWDYPYVICYMGRIIYYTHGRYLTFRQAILTLAEKGANKKEWKKLINMTGLWSNDGCILDEISISSISLKIRRSEVIGDIGHGVGISFSKDVENKVYYSIQEARKAAMEFDSTSDLPEGMECMLSGRRMLMKKHDKLSSNLEQLDHHESVAAGSSCMADSVF